jgi:hypothetical protein
MQNETEQAIKTVERVLNDVIRLNATHRRVTDALLRMYARTAKVEVHRQQLERWIAANAKRRHSPRLGTGLNLALAAAAVLEAHKLKPFKKREK